jgi:hypothetical protein
MSWRRLSFFEATALAVMIVRILIAGAQIEGRINAHALLPSQRQVDLYMVLSSPSGCVMSSTKIVEV